MKERKIFLFSLCTHVSEVRISGLTEYYFIIILIINWNYLEGVDGWGMMQIVV